MNEHRRFSVEKGYDKLYDYDLTEDSLVFEIGGYHGQFVEEIYRRFKCNIYVFEPVKEFYEIMDEAFSDKPKIKIFNIGLSDRNGEAPIYVHDDGSSLYIDADNSRTEQISLVSILSFLHKENINSADLISINTEGDEYTLLPYMIKQDITNIFNNIQIQFHDVIDNAIAKRSQIRDGLSITHRMMWNYNFIFESWQKK